MALRQTLLAKGFWEDYCLVECCKSKTLCPDQKGLQEDCELIGFFRNSGVLQLWKNWWAMAQSPEWAQLKPSQQSYIMFTNDKHNTKAYEGAVSVLTDSTRSVVVQHQLFVNYIDSVEVGSIRWVFHASHLCTPWQPPLVSDVSFHYVADVLKKGSTY